MKSGPEGTRRPKRRGWVPGLSGFWDPGFYICEGPSLESDGPLADIPFRQLLHVAFEAKVQCVLRIERALPGMRAGTPPPGVRASAVASMYLQKAGLGCIYLYMHICLKVGIFWLQGLVLGCPPASCTGTIHVSRRFEIGVSTEVRVPVKENCFPDHYLHLYWFSP